MKLRDRIAIVTGGAKGIGRAIALRLAAEGADIVLADLDLEEACKTSQEIQLLGRATFVLRSDVSDFSDVNRMVSEVQAQFGTVDILVNNAGISGAACPVAEMDESEWDRVIKTDLKSVFLCSKAVLPIMIGNSGGVIVNVASIAGKEGNPKMAAYSAAKAAVIGFTKALAKEVVDRCIRVNCVAPGVVQTSILDELTPAQIDYMIQRIPMKRTARPEEVAAVVYFLVSDDASFVTGQCYDVSGGRATY